MKAFQFRLICAVYCCLFSEQTKTLGQAPLCTLQAWNCADLDQFDRIGRQIGVTLLALSLNSRSSPVVAQSLACRDENEREREREQAKMHLENGAYSNLLVSTVSSLFLSFPLYFSLVVCSVNLNEVEVCRANKSSRLNGVFTFNCCSFRAAPGWRSCTIFYGSSRTEYVLNENVNCQSVNESCVNGNETWLVKSSCTIKKEVPKWFDFGKPLFRGEHFLNSKITIAFW